MSAPLPIVATVVFGVAGASTAISADLTSDPGQWLPTWVTLSENYAQLSPPGFLVGTPGMLDGTPNSNRGSYSSGRRVQFWEIESAGIGRRWRGRLFMNATALGRLDDGTIVRGDCPVRYPAHAPANLQGPAFHSISAVIARPYAQFNPAGLPPRPTGPPRKFTAGESATLFRCEFLALREAGAARLELDRNAALVFRNLNGTRVHVSLGDIIEAVIEDLDEAMIERWKEAPDGFVREADIEAREERIRDLARATLPEDRVKLVESNQ